MSNIRFSRSEINTVILNVGLIEVFVGSYLSNDYESMP